MRILQVLCRAACGKHAYLRPERGFFFENYVFLRVPRNWNISKPSRILVKRSPRSGRRGSIAVIIDENAVSETGGSIRVLG